MALPSPGLLNRTNRPAWGNPYNPYVGAGGGDPSVADPGGFNPYVVAPPPVPDLITGGGGPAPPIPGRTPLSAGVNPASIIGGDAPAIDTTPTGSTPAAEPGAGLMPFKARKPPGKSRAETLIAGGAKDAVGPWTALGNLAQFERGTVAEEDYLKKQAAYEQEPTDYLRKALAAGQTVDEALKSSPYPEHFKMWLAREQALQKQTPDIYQEYLLSLLPGQKPTGAGFKAYQLEMKTAASPKVNIGDNGASYPKAPEGQDYIRNPDGTVKVGEDGKPTLYFISGSKGAESKKAGDVTKQKYDRITSDDIGISLDQIANNADDIFGVRGTAGAAKTRIFGIPSERAKLDARLNTIKSSITIERINEIRAASPSGGALGAVSDNEGKLLGDAMGSLDPNIGPEGLTYNLWRIQVTKNLLENPPRNPDGSAQEVTADMVQAAIPKSVREGVRPKKAGGGDDALKGLTKEQIQEELRRRGAL